MANNIAKVVTLKSSDGEQFVVPEAVAMQSRTICHFMEDNYAENTIPLPNVHSRILAIILEYCTKHVNGTKKASDTPTKTKKAQKTEEGCLAEMPEAMSPEELKQWDAKFLDIDNYTLLNIFLAASYLDIRGLLDLTCQKMAGMTKGKKPAEISKTFNINK